MTASYDLVVLGAGSAGLSAATFAARLGARVALIDRERPGGDCLYSGCVPSKTLIKVAKVAHELRHADRFGLTPGDRNVDLARVNAHVQATIERVYQLERPEALRARGIDFYPGGARFVDLDAVVAGEHVLRGGRLLICTGARPARPHLPGLEGASYLTYEDVFHLPGLPKSLMVLGTGPVGVEMAQAFARLGSQVTVLGRSGHLLGKADPAVQATIQQVLTAEGIDLRLRHAAERVEATGDEGVAVHGSRDHVEGDALLVALGREPNVAGLDLDRAGVRASERGIAVDSSLRTTNPRVYACGDVIGGPQFSHYAAWQAYVAVRNALLPGASTGMKHHLPWAVFTDPEVATVGLTEPEARAKHGDDVVVCQLRLDHVDRAQTEGETRGLLKVVTRRSGEILGAHLVAGRAGEMVQEYVLAMAHGVRLDQLAGAIHVYPTYATANQQVEAEFWTERLLGDLKGRLLRRLLRRAPALER
jgi:pyruvate/2-oxoglutarate dehydrogenase complex dihydrolipoamide dehydrogenase (E3) component